MKVKYFLNVCSIFFIFLLQVHGANIKVDSLEDLNAAIAKSGNTIQIKPGKYDLKDLGGKSKVLSFSGSNNAVDLSGMYVNVTVGTVRETYILVTGNNNSIIGGEFEDTYSNGLKIIKDFSTYNKDRKKLAFGLRGAAVMKIEGDGNRVKGIKLTVRGSFPYGYGSYYGIGGANTFGLNKRCGILIKGIGNTLDEAEVQQRAFGHGIFMQGKADKTLIKNCLVEGRMRHTKELYEENDPEDLPRRTAYYFPNRNDFKIDSKGKTPIPKDEVHSLCEDGIRMYKIPGSVTVENCTVKNMRGGIRLYLGGPAIVKNSTAINCEYTNFNLPKKGVVINSTGNFAFSPISDYRLNKSSTKVEWTILPSPQAIGSHNIMDLLGNGHHITLNRVKGPLDTKEKKVIFIAGNKSTIINKTEYTIALAEGATGNNIISFGPVKGNIKTNKVTQIKSVE